MRTRIDLWKWRLQHPDAGDLSRDEHARAEQFVFDRDRDRYIAGRARLRKILGQYLGRPPDSIVFSYGPFGRPSVEGVEFNLSHTGDLAVLAVGFELPIGVDIEEETPIDMKVAEMHFAASEFRALQALPQTMQMAAYYRCWTRKEAYLKAMGTGLSTILSSFVVTLRPDEPAKVLSCDSGKADQWHLIDFDPGDGIAGALAVCADENEVTLKWRH